MKKNFSKTIMIIVAVLLTLVLISTSTVSGIFAKYVVTKDATTIVSLKKFGVTLDLKEGEDFKADNGMSVSPSFTGDDIGVIVTVSLVPGNDYDELIKFVASINGDGGKATVDTNIKVKAEVVALENCSYDNSYYVPVKFYAEKDEASAPLISNTSETELKNNLATNLNDKIKTILGAETPENGFYKKQIVSAGGSKLDFSSISFGVGCPKTVNSPTNADVIMTQLAEQGATVKVKYTVSLEQK